jgi:hypothetical protein
MSETVYPVPPDAAPLVLRRAAEAMAWCSGPVAIAHRLRTPELRPARPFVLERQRPDGTFTHEYLDTNDRAVEVERVGARRAELLALHGSEAVPVPRDASHGRFLVAEIDCSVWDGLSEDESDGFFDIYDVPAWDTWIHLERAKGTDALLCWVPAPLIEPVSNGIAVNCTDCIGWIDRLVYPAR